WGDIVCVVISEAPAKLIVAHATKRLGTRGTGTRRIRSNIRVNRFHALRFAPKMEMRLERRQDGRSRQAEVAIAASDLAGRQIQVAGVAHVLCKCYVLWHKSFRI